MAVGTTRHRGAHRGSGAGVSSEMRSALTVSNALAGAATLAMALALVATSAAARQPATHPSNRSTNGRVIEPDGQLRSLVQEALRQSPLIIAARSNWQALGKVPLQQSTLPDPQITFQNMAVGNPIPGNQLQANNFAYFGYGISQEIPFPGKLALRAEVARGEALAARDSYQSERRRVVEQVRESYLNLFYLTRALGLLKQTYGEFRHVASITESQYEVGMAQQHDVLKAQLATTTLLKEIATTREDFEQEQADLKAILGREQDSPDIPIGDVTLTRFDLNGRRLRELAQADSPQLKEALALEAKSADSLKLAREGYIPDLSVAYMYQKTGAPFPDYYMATIGLKVPLYFWRKQTPAVEQAGLDQESAHARTYATRLAVVSRVQNELIAAQTTNRVARLYREGLIPQAQAALSSATAAYRVGKLDFQSLLDAEIDLLRLRQQYYRTVADHEIAIARIEEITGVQR